MRLIERAVGAEREIRSARVFFLLVVWLSVVPGLADAHRVEESSQDNRLYVLLSHGNLHSSLDNVSIAIEMPSFASTAALVYTPASVPPDSARLAAFSFNVSSSAPIGMTGDALIAISGTVLGNPVKTHFSVPLTVAASAPAAVYVGSNLGAENIDTDGDGYADWVEILFGSDPVSAGSMPGALAFGVPALSAFGIVVLAGLLVLAACAAQRRASGADGGSQ